MGNEHIVKSYDEELGTLKSKITEMGREAEEQLSKAVEALIKRDTGLALEIVKNDARVNEIQDEIENLTVRMLALRQPMALDLRNIISGLKIAINLERIADHAANIAKHIDELNKMPLDEPIRSIVQMTELAKDMHENVLMAYEKRDDQKAIEIWHRDEEIDRIYSEVLTELRDIMEHDSKKVRACTTLIYVAKSCERIGDHITNVAENIYYINNGVFYHGDI